MLLITVPLAMVVVVVAVFAAAQRGVARTDAWARHSYQVLTQSAQAESALVEAQSIARAYLLTGDARLRRAYDAAAGRVPGSYAVLLSMVSDNAEQAARVRALSALAGSELACLGREIRARRGLAASGAAAIEGACFRNGRQIGRQVDAFNAAELTLKSERERRLQQARQRQQVLVLGAALAVVLVTLLAGIVFVHDVGRRLERLAEKAGKLGGADAPARAGGGRDELELLDALVDTAARAMRERGEISERYRLLVEEGRDMILFTRRTDGAIIDANAAAIACYGYTREELLGMNVRDLRTEWAERTLGPFPALDEEFIRLYISEHHTKSGRVFPVESASRVVQVGGERVVMSVNRDITERRQAEAALSSARDRALEASRLKSEFVATMSHEIRTPMNGVIAMADLLAGTGLDSEQREYAATIKESGEALLRIINDILDFSKVEAGKIELDLQTCSPARIVEGTAQIVASAGNVKGIEVISFVDPELPTTVVADAGRLRQVLVNIAGNAAKFTDRGYVIIRAKRLSERGKSVLVRFEVEDTGIGIPDAARERLFAPFAQGDGSTTRRYGGTGLGLSISKRLVELMGGELAVESAVDRGSRFWFTLPLERLEDPGAPLHLAAFSAARALITGVDGPSLCVVERYLSSWGMTCRREPDLAASSTLAADAQRAGEPFDIAVVDIGQVHAGEIWVAAAVTALRRSVRNVILLAQPGTRHEGAVLKRAGMSAYVTKPVRQSALFDALASVLAEHDRDVAGQDQAAALAQPLESTEPSAEAREMVVLLAEDNAINQRVALNQLRKLGLAAVIVENGRAAVEALAAGSFAAVLMDCQMPEMDGFEATRAIRRAEARSGEHVPIIAMTANALEEDRRACIAAGMDDYVSKPVDFVQLREVLQRWLPSEDRALG
ncbi:response regulator [bacterium]|nr:MAG: response regulator [bacterium]